MSTWHYADSQQQQRGPVDATWLQAAYARGEIGPATLLWRDGMAAWKPLAELAGELGIAVAAAPARPAPAPSIAGGGRPQVVVVAPREGASGWVIGLLIGGVVLIAIMGILAAIAIPAYQDYTVRAKVAEGINAASPLKLAVMETWMAEERCANHQDEQVGPPASYGKGLLQSITLGDEGDGVCTITLAFRDVPSPGNEGVLVLVRQDQGWRYRTSLPERYLPSSIRSQAERLD
jgi:type IV pilus assembly protein PilA